MSVVLPKLTVVALDTSADTDNPRVIPWSSGDGLRPYGVTATDSEDEQDILAIVGGIVRDCPAQGGETWGRGDKLWAAPDGSVTNVRPTAPDEQVYVGEVQKVSAGLAIVAVEMEHAPAPDDLSTVNREALADKDVLIYDLAATLWRLRQLDHGADLAGLGDDDHPQYLKEKASGGTAAEVPEHTHGSAAEGGPINHRRWLWMMGD
jgi:hypothetical protein